MYRKMRLQRRLMGDEDSRAVLKSALFGTLATVDANCNPYAVPISFVYTDDNVIYLHCAPVGYKLDNITLNNNISFSVVTDIHTLPEKFSSQFKSVIAFGKIHIIDDEQEKRRGLMALVEKYSADFYEEGLKYMETYLHTPKESLCVLKIEIEHMTGKQHE